MLSNPFATAVAALVDHKKQIYLATSGCCLAPQEQESQRVGDSTPTLFERNWGGFLRASPAASACFLFFLDRWQRWQAQANGYFDI
jgi:hypothetical protein